ncbi:MAG: AAA family ATPase [Deltaproteobacteria bacterium]|nr:AAA family ATPase [Deltaproteobacteria bacterium]
MSEIKKALQKAKEERKTLSGESQKRLQEIDNLRIDKPLSGTKRPGDLSVFPAAEAPPPIYSQTRCVQLDREKLIENKVVSILDKDEVGDEYKLLRTMVLNSMRPNGYNTIAITSFKEGDGKTLTCVNLAVTLAKESRQNVLLVDMDLRRPRIHTVLGIDPEPGLRDYFLNGTPLKDILIHPGIERLTILPAGGRMDNSTEIMGSRRMEALIREIKTRYEDRYIIFDTPALNTCSDPLVFSSYVDAIALIARAGHTTTEDMTSGMALLKDKNVLGVVLNDCGTRRGWTY